MNDHLFDPFDSELVLIGAADQAALVDAVARVIRFLEQVPTVRLEDIAYTCAVMSHGQPAIVAVVTNTVADLRARLKIVHAKLVAGAGRIRDKSGTYYVRDRLVSQGGKVAFLFPGATSFYPDMLRDVCLVFPECRAAFDELEEALAHETTFTPSNYVFPPAACYRHDADGYSAQGYAQSLIAVHAANTALYRLFTLMGITPNGLIGFAGGDLAALDVAGVYGTLSRGKRLQFLRESYHMINRVVDRADLPTCRMIALVDPKPETVESLQATYPGRIAVAFYHSARQVTIAVAQDCVDAVMKALQADGVRTMEIAIDRPFNTPWCAKILPPIKQFAAEWVRFAPSIPVYSCASACELPAQPRRILDETVDQWTAPIHFGETIQKMYDDGFRVFVELGARGLMASTISDVLKAVPHQVVAANRIHRSGLLQLHHALGMLATQGVNVDATVLHRYRRRNQLDFDNPLALAVVADSAMRLSSMLPRLSLFSAVPSADALMPSMPAPEQRAQKAAMRGNRRQRQFDFGAVAPMLNGCETLEHTPGVSIEISQILKLDDYPFLRDYALGTAQLSYTEPSLKGLTLLSLITGCEMMAELAQKLAPNRRVVQIENLRSQRWVSFEDARMTLFLRAERVAWQDSTVAAVKVQLRDDSPNSAYTWPIMEATILLGQTGTIPQAIRPPALSDARPVHWTEHDIYPDKLFHGESLRIVKYVDLWSMGGIDYEVEVPRRAHAVRYTRIPLFAIHPLLLDGIISGFSLWRSHERFAGAVSMPFRVRRIMLYASNFSEGARLRGYLRLIAVTPRSHVADILVSDGNGNLLLEFRGWEELCERVPREYHQFILSPATTFLTRELSTDLLGNPATAVATAMVNNLPFKIFEQNSELWLRTLADALLSPIERGEFREMTGAPSRRTEWLFGRAAAKEAVRRFLLENYQARWTAADVQIWADDSGKPHPIGAWSDLISVDIDLSIAHTNRLVIAAVAANARIGLDIEAVGRDLSDEFTRGVFLPEELELAAQAIDAPSVILRFWCAKEAVSKALGTGIRYSPRELVVVSILSETGDIAVELRGQWLSAFKQFKGRSIAVTSSIYEEHAFAACLLPSSLFEGN